MTSHSQALNDTYSFLTRQKDAKETAGVGRQIVGVGRQIVGVSSQTKISKPHKMR